MNRSVLESPELDQMLERAKHLPDEFVAELLQSYFYHIKQGETEKMAKCLALQEMELL